MPPDYESNPMHKRLNVNIDLQNLERLSRA